MYNLNKTIIVIYTFFITIYVTQTAMLVTNNFEVGCRYLLNKIIIILILYLYNYYIVVLDL